MARDAVSVVISSRSRLKIADLLSTRPRTLGELADATGISVPAVLKHLEKLDRLGLLEKKKVSAGGLSVRRLYSLKGVNFGDFSIGDLTIVKMTESRHRELRSKDAVGELETLAEDALIQRRRIREQARKLGRMIDELVEEESRLNGLVESLELDDEERLVVQTAFTEETLEEAEKTLSRIHGMPDSRRSIERALVKARRNAKR